MAASYTTVHVARILRERLRELGAAWAAVEVAAGGVIVRACARYGDWTTDGMEATAAVLAEELARALPHGWYERRGARYADADTFVLTFTPTNDG